MYVVRDKKPTQIILLIFFIICFLFTPNLMASALDGGAGQTPTNVGGGAGGSGGTPDGGDGSGTGGPNIPGGTGLGPGIGNPYTGGGGGGGQIGGSGSGGTGGTSATGPNPVVGGSGASGFDTGSTGDAGGGGGGGAISAGGGSGGSGGGDDYGGGGGGGGGGTGPTPCDTGSGSCGGNGGAGAQGSFNDDASAGGGGGGGGGLGTVYSTAAPQVVSSDLKGGDGGAGGTGNYTTSFFGKATGGGGGGGAGAHAILSTQNAQITINSNVTVKGGNGGAGGDATSGSPPPPIGNGGNGGNAGSGIALAAGGVITNSAQALIIGGKGGAGGAAGQAGAAGSSGFGGLGIWSDSSNSVTIYNSGSISAGLGYSVAIFLENGSSNVLQLNSTYSISGVVVAEGANNTLTLGSGVGSFDVTQLNLLSGTTYYDGFSLFTVDGTATAAGPGTGTAGTWTLQNTTSTVTNWSVNNGATLIITSAANLGAGTALTLAAGSSSGSTLMIGTSSAAINLTQSITLMGAAGGIVDITNVGTNGLTLSGPVLGGAPLTINNTSGSSSNTLTLTNSPNSQSQTTVNNSTLSISTECTLGCTGSVPIGSLTLNGATLQTASAITSTRSITIGSGGGTLSLAGNSSFSGVISGTGNGPLVINGGQTVTLSGANTYTGSTTMNTGTLSISTDCNLGCTGATPNGSLILNGATLQTAAGITTARNITIGAAGGTLSLGGNSAFSGVISGTGNGPLVINGGQTVTLSGANTYTGSTTMNTGTLSISTDCNLGCTGGVSNGGLILSSATLQTTGAITSTRNITLSSAGAILSLGGNATFSGVISGTGSSLVINGGQTVTLSGSNTYTGSTTMNAGTLIINSDCSLGCTGGASNGSLTLNGATLQTTAATTSTRAITISSAGATLNLGGNLTLSGLISGAGNGPLAVSGSHTLTLSNAGNTYTGSTTVNASTTVSINTDCELGCTGGAPNGSLILNGGTLQTTAAFASSRAITINPAGGTVLLGGNLTLSGLISGAGNGPLTVGGGYTLTLSNAGNTYTGSTTVNASTTVSINTDCELGCTGVTPNGSLNLNGGTLMTTASFSSARLVNLFASGGTFNTTAGALTLSGVISGLGSLTAQGGSLTLSAANNYTGATYITSGSLVITGGGSIATSSSVNLISSTSVFSIGAAGAQIIQDLWGVASSQINLVNNSLTEGTPRSSLFAGVLNGSGLSTFNKQGSGTLNLSGNSGSTFLGTFNVQSGTLNLINASLGGNLNVSAGAILSGTGAVGNTVVNGIISPGNSIGTLTINGSFVQASGSSYQLDINEIGGSDLIFVNGPASIQSNTTVNLLQTTGQFAPNTRYTILTATGGVTGVYQNLHTNSPLITFTLNYDANNVYLDILRNGATMPSIARTPNELAVAGALESLSTDTTGDTGFGTVGMLNPLYIAVLNLPTVEAIRFALNDLSGEIHASIRGAFVEQTRYLRDAVLNRLSGGLDNFDKTVFRDPESGSAFWMEGYGSWGQLDTNHNAAELRRGTRGFFVGVDTDISGFEFGNYEVNDGMRAGIVLGYGHSTLNVRDRFSYANTADYHAGIYGGGAYGVGDRDNAVTLFTGLTYSHYAIDTERYVVFPGINNTLKSEYPTGVGQAFAELGYESLKNERYHVEPMLQMAVVNVGAGTFSEYAGIAQLQGQSVNKTFAYSTVGMRANAMLNQAEGELEWHLGGLVGWQYAYTNIIPVGTFSFIASTPFIIGGTPIAVSSAVIDLGLDAALPGHDLHFTLGYIGEIASNVVDNGVQGTLTWRF